MARYLQLELAGRCHALFIPAAPKLHVASPSPHSGYGLCPLGPQPREWNRHIRNVGVGTVLDVKSTSPERKNNCNVPRQALRTWVTETLRVAHNGQVLRISVPTRSGKFQRGHRPVSLMNAHSSWPNATSKTFHPCTSLLGQKSLTLH